MLMVCQTSQSITDCNFNHLLRQPRTSWFINPGQQQADSGGEHNTSDLNADNLVDQVSDSDFDWVDSDFKMNGSDDGEELDEEVELERSAMEDSNDKFDTNAFHNYKF